MRLLHHLITALNYDSTIELNILKLGYVWNKQVNTLLPRATGRIGYPPQYCPRANNSEEGPIRVGVPRKPGINLYFFFRLETILCYFKLNSYCRTRPRPIKSLLCAFIKLNNTLALWLKYLAQRNNDDWRIVLCDNQSSS